MKEALQPHYAIRRILGSVHCSRRNLNAIRCVIDRCWPKAENPRACFLKMPKQHRRFFTASCLMVHASNYRTYLAVMSLRDIPDLEGRYVFDTETKQVEIRK